MDAVEKVYTRLPTLRCRGLCAHSCGPIVFSQKEADRMARKGVPEPGFDATGTCTALKNDRCSIYKNRPLICRFWGMVKAMTCPHGCVPSRFVTPEEENAYMRALGPLRPGDHDILEAFRQSKPE